MADALGRGVRCEMPGVRWEASGRQNLRAAWRSSPAIRFLIVNNLGLTAIRSVQKWPVVACALMSCLMEGDHRAIT